MMSYEERPRRWLHENTDKRHRCPSCHCVVPWRYGRLRKLTQLTDFTTRLDIKLPRICRECGTRILPQWICTLIRKEKA